MNINHFQSRPVVNLRHSEPTHSVMATLDGEPLENYPVHLPWMRLEKLPGEQISVLLMAIQVRRAVQKLYLRLIQRNELVSSSCFAGRSHLLHVQPRV